jgi:hypothetical protein
VTRCGEAIGCLFEVGWVAKIVPDQQWPGMWRVQLPNGYLSDIVNRSRAKDAALTLAYTNA